MTCGNCGKRIVRRSKYGRPPKWCSDRCRKTALYSGTCLDCGTRTEGIASGYDKEILRCVPCAQAENHRQVIAAGKLMREEVAALWAEGKPVAEIGRVLGIKPNSMAARIVEYRREGVPLPYRRKFTAKGLEGLRRSGRGAAVRLSEERQAA